MAVPILTLAFLTSFVAAQFPSTPTDLTILASKLDQDVKISYKETRLCETTPGVRSFSGFVHLPHSSLYEMDFGFNISTYFLYFEARNDPENAPLGIYLAGGPGESSAFTAMSGEGGPCYVNPDSNSTTLNPWSFNNHANMLYIDQPVGAGFSYTSLINGTYDALSATITPLSEYEEDIPLSNATFGQGTYTNPIPWSTTNTTLSSAQALWHFAEHWLTQFPEFKSVNKKIGIWGNSAGGMWAPATGALLVKKIKEADKSSPLREWKVDNVGITNGLVDFGDAMPYYIEFAYNNTYGQFISNDSNLQERREYAKKMGCRDLVTVCRSLADEGDTLGRGTNQTVNSACRDASNACQGTFGVFQRYNNVTAFDIAVRTSDETTGGDPCPYYFPVHTFLNQDWTLKELGVPLNFTYISNTVLASFTLLPGLQTGTGGAVRTDKRDLEFLLQNRVKVALVYGDRDSRCPWNAAEGVALSANYPGREEFNRAGYEYIQTNSTYRGGVVRQYGNLSFSRVFQAGHGVNTYQPATVERIFNRTISGRDVATGEKPTSGGYLTEGPFSSFYMLNETLPETPGTCMVVGTFQNQSIFSIISDLSGQGEPTNSNNGSDKNGSKDGDGTSGAISIKPQINRSLSATAVGGVKEATIAAIEPANTVLSTGVAYKTGSWGKNIVAFRELRPAQDGTISCRALDNSSFYKSEGDSIALSN
ncbi:Carboxypeptidase S1 [Paramyrothecium foliicola]|nr:Carboxypeptidase S1 [Paramyrothecium foliicola]